MRHAPTVLVLSATLALTAALPAPARACGPGVHAREAARFVALLAEREPVWGERAAEPRAMSYLALGTIAPDLQWWFDVGFGHETELSYHLLDAAEGRGTGFHMAALGHLAHIASDPACEVFAQPALFASAPVGVFDMWAGEDGPQGEAGSAQELYGDMITGDWDAIVDILYDFWMEPGGSERLREIVGWYCEEASAFTGRPTDCAGFVADLEGMLGMANQLLGTQTREQAKRFFAGLTDQPLPQLAETYGSGALMALIGASGNKSADFDAEFARFKASPLTDPEFWSLYDESLDETGPHFALDRYTLRPTDGWPGWDGDALVCGNVQSVMQFLPDVYAPGQGLIVDDIYYTDGAGERISAVTAELAGSKLEAHVRLYAALPFAGTIVGAVRRDHPGLDPAGDEVAGTAEVTVELDPRAYVVTPRTELVVPFEADTTGIVGFYLELATTEEPRPWLTTSWDRLWQAPGLDVGAPVFRNNFGTYHRNPPSLAVLYPDAGAEAAALLVRVRVAPAGPPIAAATVRLVEADASATTPASGIAAFPTLAPGAVTAETSAAGYAPPDAPLALTLSVLETRWAEVLLHALPLPRVAGPFVAAGAPLDLTFEVAAFAGQAAQFLAQPLDEATATALADEADVGRSGTAALALDAAPADGTRVVVRVRARYGDGTDGVEGLSEAVVVDGSAPAITAVRFAPEDVSCLRDAADSPLVPPGTVEVDVTDPHSGIATLEWRLGRGDWTPANAAFVGGTARFALPRHAAAVYRELVVRAANGAGLVAESTPLVLEAVRALCTADEGPATDVASGPDAGPAPDVAPTPDAAVDAVLAPDAGTPPGGDGSGGGGCQAGGTAATPWTLLALALAAWAARRARPARVRELRR